MNKLVVLILSFYWSIGLSTELLPFFGEKPQPKVDPLVGRVEQLEKRLSNKTFFKMFNQMQELKTEVQQLRGEIERLNNKLDSMKKRQRGFYLDLDQRISKFEGTSASDSGYEFSPLSVEPEPPAPEKEQAQFKPATAAAEKAYQKAYQTLQKGEYLSAIDLFKKFLKQYPRGEYADNAQYWLAEAYYVRRDFQQAREEFNKIRNEYPRSSKLRDALLKIGFIEYEEKNWEKAKQILNNVVNNYPNTTVARLARERLYKISRDGY